MLTPRTPRRRPRRAPAAVAMLTMVAMATIAAGCGPMGKNADPGRDARGNTGAVTAGHPLAAEAGLAVLEAGGLAMDAAITAAAVLAVARPHMNGVGGDTFLLYYDTLTNLTYALNGSGRSGSAKTLEELKAEGLERIPGSGPRSVSVPGTVGAWAEGLRRFGTLSFAQALQRNCGGSRRRHASSCRAARRRGQVTSWRDRISPRRSGRCSSTVPMSSTAERSGAKSCGFCRIGVVWSPTTTWPTTCPNGRNRSARDTRGSK